MRFFYYFFGIFFVFKDGENMDWRRLSAWGAFVMGFSNEIGEGREWERERR